MRRSKNKFLCLLLNPLTLPSPWGRGNEQGPGDDRVDHIRASAESAKPLTRAALIAALVFPAVVHAEAPPLTLGDAQRRAVDFSRQLAAREAAVAASRDMAVAAGELPDPMIELGVDNLPIEGADRYSLTRDAMTMRRIGITQEFTRGEKRRLRGERGALEVDRALAERDEVLVTVERETALAWLERYYAEAEVRLVAGQIDEARLASAAAEGAYAGGRGGQAEVIAARSAFVELENRASEAQRRVRAARLALARWIGDADAEAPLADRPAIDVLVPELGSLEEHLIHHPEIAALSRQAEIAQTEAKLAQAERKPDWSGELMYARRGDAYGDMISVGVSIPLQWNRRNRQDREVAARLALAEQARAQREDLLRMHLAEVRTMIEEWKDGRERGARYERELIPLAADRVEAVVAAYRGGKASLADVLAARREALETRLRALQVEAETARAWARLSFLFPREGGGAVSPDKASMNPSSERK